MLIPIEWMQRMLVLIAAVGIALGMFSLLSPGRSIRLYQKMMEAFNWLVEPIDYQREFRTTRIFGVVIVAFSTAIFIVLARSGVLPLLW